MFDNNILICILLLRIMHVKEINHLSGNKSFLIWLNASLPPTRCIFKCSNITMNSLKSTCSCQCLRCQDFLPMLKQTFQLSKLCRYRVSHNVGFSLLMLTLPLFPTQAPSSPFHITLILLPTPAFLSLLTHRLLHTNCSSISTHCCQVYLFIWLPFFTLPFLPFFNFLLLFLTPYPSSV